MRGREGDLASHEQNGGVGKSEQHCGGGCGVWIEVHKRAKVCFCDHSDYHGHRQYVLKLCKNGVREVLKKMVLKHWILPIDHFEAHLFFKIFGWGDPSQLGSCS